jgi:hypothetical protein
MTLAVYLLALVTSLSQSGKAPAPPASPFETGKDIACSFPTYAAVQWADAGPRVLDGNQTFNIRIGSIDLKKKNAMVAGTSGVSLASAFVTSTGLNIIEQTPAGNFTFTTVFLNGAKGGNFLAVHSRHLGDSSGLPSVSQAYGTCQLADPVAPAK